MRDTTSDKPPEVPVQALRFVLARRPDGAPVPGDFRLETVALPGPDDLAEGEVLLAHQYLSLDPYMRGRIRGGKSYATPTPVGGVLPGEVIGQVLVSRHPGLEAGQHVSAMSGWQSASVVPGDQVRVLPDHGLPVTTALGVLGMPGFTAYAGLSQIGRVKAGETLVVAAAAGPVGSTVAQLAKAAGARVVGIAGGAEKCAFLSEELHLDVAVDHRSASLRADLEAACPGGIDVYWENVGGPVLDAVLPLMNLYGRIPVCGMVAWSNHEGEHAGPDQLPATWRLILDKSLTVRGFVQREFREQYWGDFQRDMTQLLTSGAVKVREDIVDGFENAPQAFAGLLEGKNFGKLIVRVDR